VSWKLNVVTAGVWQPDLTSGLHWAAADTSSYQTELAVETDVLMEHGDFCCRIDPARMKMKPAEAQLLSVV
jgi:hypothetical protein